MAITPALKVAKVFGNAVEVTNETDYGTAERTDYALVVGVTRPNGVEKLYIADAYATAESLALSFNEDGCYRVAIYSINIWTLDLAATLQPDDVFFKDGDLILVTFGGSEELSSLYDHIPADKKAETYYLADFQSRQHVANLLTNYWQSHSVLALNQKNNAEKNIQKARLHYNSFNFVSADSTLKKILENG